MAKFELQPVDLMSLIKYVAKEQKYKVEVFSDSQFSVFINRHHGVAYHISRPGEYIQASQWEDGTDKYGRAVYSIRDHSDAIQFCNVLIASAAIRAKRR